MSVSWNRNGDVHAGSHKGPDEARNHLCPSAEDLHRQGYRVDVGTVVCDDAECQNHQTKFAKPSQRWKQNCREKTTHAGLIVTTLVSVVTSVDIGSSHDCDTEHLAEQKRNDEAQPRPQEDFSSRLCGRLIDGVIGCIACPARGKPVYDSSETEHTTHFRCSDRHGNVDKGA